MEITPNTLTFHEYHDCFAAAVQRHPNVKLERLAHGGLIAQINDHGPRLAVIAGLHGDERSGPLALLEWVSCQDGPLVPPGCQVWLMPLLNDLGWNQGIRRWNDLDLNRSFLPGENTPAFVQQVMESWRDHPPAIFLDMHEDYVGEPDFCLFKYNKETHDFADRMAAHLQCNLEHWEDVTLWQGADELVIRDLGCTHCVTIEAPTARPMAERIRWNMAAVQWCLEQL
jgi:predicted deacylase